MTILLSHPFLTSVGIEGRRGEKKGQIEGEMKDMHSRKGFLMTAERVSELEGGVRMGKNRQGLGRVGSNGRRNHSEGGD